MSHRLAAKNGNATRILMKQTHFKAILSHAKKHAPQEACGLLAGIRKGSAKTVEKVYPLTNLDASTEHFSMDPKEQFAALKDMRKNGWTLLGNFHSHPAAPPLPSEEDRRLAYDTEASYLILSLAGDGPVLRSFQIDESKNVLEEDLAIR